MTEATINLDDDVKRVQIQIAQIELKIKKRELVERSSSIRANFRNPVVVAAMITGWVAMASLLFGWITSSQQAKTERAKFQSQLNSALLIDAFQITPGYVLGRNQENTISKLRLYLDSKLLVDSTGAIKRYIDMLDQNNATTKNPN